MNDSIQNFKPSDIDISSRLCGSDFNKSELETIASNIIIISKGAGDKWAEFSWEEYKKLCNHQVTDEEGLVLLEMVERGYLDFEEGRFSVNLRFLRIISAFLDTPERRAEKQAVKEKYADREAKRKRNLESFQRALKAHDGEITFEILKDYANKFSFKVSYIKRDSGRIDLYLEYPWEMGKLAVAMNLQEAVKKGLEVIAEMK